jgi:hypothetical protein
MNDPVNPNHYKDGAIECIDAMESSMTPEAFAGYCKGNVIKYVWRYEKKDQLEGLLKAQWYLNRLIQKVEEPSMVSLEDVEIEEMASSSISQHL